MAKESRPDPNEKREILHSEKEIDYKSYGDSYFDSEKYNDAIDFYARGECKEGLERIKSVAVGEGDYFLLKRLKKLIPETITEDDWKKLATSAESNGKTNFAAWAGEEWGKRDAKGGHEGEEP